jgi:hypothetical protein
MDIVIGAAPWGPDGEAAVALAHEQAWMRFEPLLTELMDLAGKAGIGTRTSGEGEG